MGNTTIPCNLSGSNGCAADKFSEEINNTLAKNEGLIIKDNTVEVQLGSSGKSVELSVEIEGNPKNRLYSSGPIRTCYRGDCPYLRQCKERS
jgi:hypothetical protein